MSREVDDHVLASRLSRSGVCKMLGISPTYLHSLIQTGVVPKPDSDGLLPVGDTVRGYLSKIRPRKGKGGNLERFGDGDDPNCERDDNDQQNYKFLLDKERWREMKRENDVAEKLLVPADDVSDAVTVLVGEIKPVIETLHLAALRAYPGLPAQALAAIENKVARVVNKMIDNIKVNLGQEDGMQ